MRTYLKEYQVISCQSLPEALKKMQQKPSPIPLAGGTDLMVYLHYHKLPAGTYLNLQSIPELKQAIQIGETKVVFSALTTYMEVRLHPFFREQMKMLKQAAAVVGAPGIQSLGTWVGNIVNASPAADGVPALMAYDASIILVSSEGARSVFLADFYYGYKQMDRRADEIITAIHIPIPAPGAQEYYRKVGERKAQAISKVLLAARVYVDSNGILQKPRIVYGSVMPYTYRSRSIEKILEGRKLDEKLIQQAVHQVGEELRPIDDIRSTARYRLKVAQNLMEEFLTNVLAGKG